MAGLRLLALVMALWPLGGSAAVFGPAAQFELSGTDPTDIDVSDLDRDGALDVAVAMFGLSSSDGKISLHLGDGKGSLADHPIAVPFKPYGLAAGDWNGDALPDLAVSQGDEAGNIHLYLGTGGGSFVRSEILTGAGAFPTALIARDFNRDSVPDLAVAAAVGAGLTLFNGTGDGTFNTARSVADAARWQATDMAVADFNGDGLSDLALPAGILAGAGDGTFSELAGLGGSAVIEAVDVDGDGRYEAVVGAADGLNIWRIVPGEGPVFLDTVVLPAPAGLAGGDIDGDGRAELIATDRSAGTVRLIEWNGVGKSDTRTIANCIEPGPVALADLDGDRLDDLLVACRGLGERAILLALMQNPPGSAPVPTPVVGFVPAQYRVNEADGAVSLSVERDSAEGDSRIAFATAPGTALGDLDYVTRTGTLDFPAGTTRRTLSISVLDDAFVEGEERFHVQLSSEVNALVGVAAAEVTIVDDEVGSAGTVEILNPLVSAGEQDGVAHVTVSRSGDGPLAVGYATEDGTAFSGTDFIATAGTLNFAGGPEQRTIAIALIDDDLPESTETFTLRLSGAPLAGTNKAEISILDNERPSSAPSVVPLSEITVAENSPMALVRFRRDGDASAALTLSYRTVDGPAVGGRDFEAGSGTLRFEAGEMEAIVTITIRDDEEQEAPESFLVRLSDTTGETVAEAVVTITDDDGAGPQGNVSPTAGGGGGVCYSLLLLGLAGLCRRSGRNLVEAVCL